MWALEEKQRLIESILCKYPIPALFIAERDGYPGTYEIIDGLQRLQAIMAFIETSFPTLEQSYFNLKHFPTAKARADEGMFEAKEAGLLLNEAQVSSILDYSLAISVMRNASEAEINDVFDRINTYGRRLSDQDRRQAGVQTEFATLVRNLGSALREDDSAEIVPLKPCLQ